MAFASEVDSRREALESLRRLSRRSPPHSLSFFDQLVELLPATFGMDLALVAEVGQERATLRTVALSFNRRPLETLEIPQVGTAALEAVRVGHLYVGTGARQRFPNDN